MAQQPGYQMFHYQPPYYSYPGPALPHHALSSVTPAFTFTLTLEFYAMKTQQKAAWKVGTEKKGTAKAEQFICADMP